MASEHRLDVYATGEADFFEGNQDFFVHVNHGDGRPAADFRVPNIFELETWERVSQSEIMPVSKIKILGSFSSLDAMRTSYQEGETPVEEEPEVDESALKAQYLQELDQVSPLHLHGIQRTVLRIAAACLQGWGELEGEPVSEAAKDRFRGMVLMGLDDFWFKNEYAEARYYADKEMSWDVHHDYMVMEQLVTHYTNLAADPPDSNLFQAGRGSKQHGPRVKVSQESTRMVLQEISDRFEAFQLEYADSPKLAEMLERARSIIIYGEDIPASELLYTTEELEPAAQPQTVAVSKSYL